jgi:hypothetical protein
MAKKKTPSETSFIVAGKREVTKSAMALEADHAKAPGEKKRGQGPPRRRAKE